MNQLRCSKLSLTIRGGLMLAGPDMFALLAVLAGTSLPPSSGPVIRMAALNSIVVVLPDSDPGCDQRRQAGARLLLDPVTLGGCLPVLFPRLERIIS